MKNKNQYNTQTILIQSGSLGTAKVALFVAREIQANNTNMTNVLQNPYRVLAIFS